MSQKQDYNVNVIGNDTDHLLSHCELQSNFYNQNISKYQHHQQLDELCTLQTVNKQSYKCTFITFISQECLLVATRTVIDINNDVW
jgi:hypothetical protein